MEKYQNRIVAKKTIPERTAIYSEFPNELNAELKEFLQEERGIQQLYSHQAEMFNRAQNNENVVITTSTASGKTLSFLLPVIQEILKNPKARAIFLYPTKALASDQYRNMKPFIDYFGQNKIQAGVYDGDTPPNERSRIKSSANIILTNPDMLNTGFLPHHNKSGFKFIFSNLKFIVLDELHTYRGAFGSHIANLVNRINRICKYYNTSPQYLCSSATIANPVELAQNICGKEFHLVEKDGSPAPKKTYYVWQPPVVGKDGFRLRPEQEAAKFLPNLVVNNESFISFCKSRRAVEVVLKESRDELKDGIIAGLDYSNLISGYRGGYKPEERKEIENKMVTGILKGLVSTNALELGIDIGKIDNTVIVGYPGTRASFWQQSGRAGRSGKEAFTYLILDNLPFDQYIAIDSEWLFSTGSENAVIDKNNLTIQLSHIRAAAAEIPLTLDDVEIFPNLGEVVPVLMNGNELKNQNGRFVWIGKDFPAGDFSLRNMNKESFKLKNKADLTLLTEMDELQAYREIHKGAIYIHDGQMYQVEEMDLINRLSIASPIEVNYHTVPFSNKIIKIVKDFENEDLGRVTKHFGDVQVTDLIVAYKRIQFHNHQNLGFEKLEQPLSKSFNTEGARILLPNNVSDILGIASSNRPDNWKTYFDGIGFSLLGAAKMITMSTNEDINVNCMLENSGEGLKSSVCIYDLYIGGLGFAEKVYEVYDLIVKQAITMVRGCKCNSGCPACVGDYSLDKNLIIWGLENILEELQPLKNIEMPEQPPKVTLEKQFKFDELQENWQGFTSFLKSTGEYLTDFISNVQSVRIHQDQLILIISNQFYKQWLLDEHNYNNLINTFKYYVEVPHRFSIDVEVNEDINETFGLNKKIQERFAKLNE